MSYPGNWVTCRAGDPAPMGAVVSPDQWRSYVCLWPEKDMTLGRGKENLHMTGMDAWFPYGGLEFSAFQQGCTFQVLVDDGRTPGQYSWIEVEKYDKEKHSSEYEPLLVNGYSPVVIHNILGKGQVRYQTGWTCYAGAETSHDKRTVQRSLVLCRLKPGHSQRKMRDWRELTIQYPGRITKQQIKTICVQKASQRLINTSDSPRTLTLDFNYQTEEGQLWQTGVAKESTDLDTVIKSENIVRQLIEADFAVGKALFGSKLDHIERGKTSVHRTYTVPPETDMSVTVSVFKQHCDLKCQAQENVFNREGRMILTRPVNGRWYGVTTTEIRAEIIEQTAVKGPK